MSWTVIGNLSDSACSSSTPLQRAASRPRLRRRTPARTATPPGTPAATSWCSSRPRGTQRWKPAGRTRPTWPASTPATSRPSSLAWWWGTWTPGLDSGARCHSDINALRKSPKAEKCSGFAGNKKKILLRGTLAGHECTLFI